MPAFIECTDPRPETILPSIRSPWQMPFALHPHCVKVFQPGCWSGYTYGSRCLQQLCCANAISLVIPPESHDLGRGMLLAVPSVQFRWPRIARTPQLASRIT